MSAMSERDAELRHGEYELYLLAVCDGDTPWASVHASHDDALASLLTRYGKPVPAPWGLTDDYVRGLLADAGIGFHVEVTIIDTATLDSH